MPLDASLSTAALLSASCSGCHLAGNAAIPDIRGLSPDAMFTALSDYKIDTDGPTIMHRLMAGYSDPELRAIADYLGAQGE
ncbi:MAG: cytochrome c [Hellea sp.]|nr:cytochrome c [Hellea sp.]